MSHGESSPDYVSYLLRIWREGASRESSHDEGKPTWRASVDNVLTGERRGFANLDELFDFLRRHEESRLDRCPTQEQP